jgi:hypothetical protein
MPRQHDDSQVFDRWVGHLGDVRLMWKIVERTIVTDWARVSDPSAMDLSHPITKDTLRGTLDETDPSYRFFSLLTGR